MTWLKTRHVQLILTWSIFVAQIEQVSPGFSERYLLQPEQFAHELAQYRTYIHDMVAIADPGADADEFAGDIVDFSKSLAKVTHPNIVFFYCLANTERHPSA